MGDRATGQPVTGLSPTVLRVFLTRRTSEMRNRHKNPLLLATMATRGETGRSLSRKTDLHCNTISRVLNGRVRPSPLTARKIADALGTTSVSLGFHGGAGS